MLLDDEPTTFTLFFDRTFQTRAGYLFDVCVTFQVRARCGWGGRGTAGSGGASPGAAVRALACDAPATPPLTPCRSARRGTASSCQRITTSPTASRPSAPSRPPLRSSSATSSPDRPRVGVRLLLRLLLPVRPPPPLLLPPLLLLRARRSGAQPPPRRGACRVQRSTNAHTQPPPALRCATAPGPRSPFRPPPPTQASWLLPTSQLTTLRSQSWSRPTPSLCRSMRVRGAALRRLLVRSCRGGSLEGCDTSSCACSWRQWRRSPATTPSAPPPHPLPPPPALAAGIGELRHDTGSIWNFSRIHAYGDKGLAG